MALCQGSNSQGSSEWICNILNDVFEDSFSTNAMTMPYTTNGGFIIMLWIY